MGLFFMDLRPKFVYFSELTWLTEGKTRSYMRRPCQNAGHQSCSTWHGVDPAVTPPALKLPADVAAALALRHLALTRRLKRVRYIAPDALKFTTSIEISQPRG